jgi:hypothetical protein
MNGRNLNYLGMTLCAVTVWASAAGSAFASPMPELVEISKRLANKDRWPEHNDPQIFDKNYVFNYEKLMTKLEARITDEKMPWSDTWWPARRGGIANRWQIGPEYPTFWPGDYLSEQSRVLAMSPEEIKFLSPAEKYDIAVGDYTFGLTRDVIRNSKANAPEWWGICEGWTGAAMSYAEPDVVTVTNPDGVTIEFGSSDVKALLALFYSWEGIKASRQLGLRCGAGPGEPYDPATSDCYDVHPAAFHVVLLNQIGFMNTPIGADVDGGSSGGIQNETWNQPVFAYKTNVLEEWDCEYGYCQGTAEGTVRQVLVETHMTFADDERPVWQPTMGTSEFFQETRYYQYWLEIDGNGNIVGGSWVTSARPDFLWVVPTQKFSGVFAGLDKIYKPAPKLPYCVPQHYIDASTYNPNIPLYPFGPSCDERR